MKEAIEHTLALSAALLAFSFCAVFAVLFQEPHSLSELISLSNGFLAVLFLGVGFLAWKGTFWFISYFSRNFGEIEDLEHFTRAGKTSKGKYKSPLLARVVPVMTIAIVLLPFVNWLVLTFTAPETAENIILYTGLFLIYVAFPLLLLVTRKR